MNTQINDESIDSLLKAAKAAQKNAYAPYSRFQVGAALLAADGTIISGANVENASYGATICAERSAICSAVSAGKRDFVAIGLFTDCPKAAWPCGMCRQVLAEFAPDMPVYSTTPSAEVEKSSVAELLPLRFGHGDLDL